MKDSQFTSSAAGNSNSVPDEQEEEEEDIYQLQSPYYSLEHPLEFYKDE